MDLQLARPGFERASTVCPVLAQSGQPTGFERGPAGQARTARLSPSKSRLGYVRATMGLIFNWHGLMRARAGLPVQAQGP